MQVVPPPEIVPELPAEWPPPALRPPSPVHHRAPRRRRSPRLVVVAVVALLAGALAGGVTARWLVDGPTTRVVHHRTVYRSATSRVPEIIVALAPSVVTIDDVMTVQGPFGRTTTEAAAGTGVVVSADGDIATNAHVVADATDIEVTFSDGTKAPAAVVGIDEDADIAVIHVDRTDLTPVTFGDSEALMVGDAVVALGNALALEGGPTASAGIVSALDRSITLSDGSVYSHLVQTDASINSGDSGGPLVNAAGEVVGINTATANEAENIGFAISSNRAVSVIARLRAA